MKKNIFQWILLGISIFSLITLSSCGGGSNSNPDPLQKPSNITVIREGNGLRVSWSAVTGAVFYQLFRKDGDGSFAIIPSPGSQITATSYLDTNFPPDKTLQYAVVAHSQSGFSSQSDPSNEVSEQVQDIKATKMQFTDRIELHWTAHPENPDSYKIYRKSVANNDVIFLAETTDNFYLDSTAATNEIHYYRITWVKLGVEYGDDVELVYGVRGADNDVFEANDVPDYPAILIKENSGTAYTYTLSDHSNGYKSDSDWYQYHKSSPDPETLIVQINLPSGSPFLGKLKLQFYENNLPIGIGNILSDTENLCIYNMPGNVTDISFKVEPVLVNGNEGIGSYTILLQ